MKLIPSFQLTSTSTTLKKLSNVNIKILDDGVNINGLFSLKLSNANNKLNYAMNNLPTAFQSILGIIVSLMSAGVFANPQDNQIIYLSNQNHTTDFKIEPKMFSGHFDLSSLQTGICNSVASNSTDVDYGTFIKKWFISGKTVFELSQGSNQPNDDDLSLCLQDKIQSIFDSNNSFFHLPDLVFLFFLILVCCLVGRMTYEGECQRKSHKITELDSNHDEEKAHPIENTALIAKPATKTALEKIKSVLFKLNPPHLIHSTNHEIELQTLQVKGNKM